MTTAGDPPSSSLLSPLSCSLQTSAPEESQRQAIPDGKVRCPWSGSRESCSLPKPVCAALRGPRGGPRNCPRLSLASCASIKYTGVIYQSLFWMSALSVKQGKVLGQT